MPGCRLSCAPCETARPPAPKSCAPSQAPRATPGGRCSRSQRPVRVCLALPASRSNSSRAQSGDRRTVLGPAPFAFERRCRWRQSVLAARICRAPWSPRTGRFTFRTSTVSIPRWRIGPAFPTHAPRAPASWPARRCGARARRSAFSSSTGTGSRPSRPRSLHSSKVLRTRPSSPSRTRGCSTKCRRGRTSSRKRSSSKPPPLKS